MNFAISEFFNMVSKMSETFKSYIENASNVDTLKEKKRLKKATNYTEELINEIREKALEYDKIFEYSKSFAIDCLSKEDYNNYLKSIKHARNSRKIIRLIRKIEKLD